MGSMPLLLKGKQEKFLGLFENPPKVYVIHREGIFGQNAKHKINKSLAIYTLFYQVPEIFNYGISTSTHIKNSPSALHGPGNFNVFLFFILFF